MRHGKKVNHLSRKSAHRKALLRNLTIALITHKRINTTLAKAKALRVYAEPLITKSKSNDTHNRRTVFSYLQDKVAVEELFSTVADKVADRPGGYLRVIKTGFRLGDGAEMAMIELVDFNEVYNKDGAKSTGKTRRSRRRRGGSNKSEIKATSAGTTAAAAATPAAPAPPADAPASGEEE
ncbi:large subunit ribosomal protein L17 [Lewinella aquimaris]|uniref:Large ribosomal subunit protein bL17 n=1 Tax=Neolewinella aquimaris TaxID=1835722 RepID=A0A840E481_9BACT|nr:large subunit ribosomal protein L17 [Neolewinella aquimaris]